jgi:bifunctional ADP-heptose synthase (sugar kinase/adenylyltransferase)
VPEAAIVAKVGGRVVIVGDPKDHSTTELISRVRNGSKP